MLRASEKPLMKNELPPLEYLLECSRTSLGSFRYAQLTRAANRRKEIKSIVDEWVEAQALALLANWLETYGDELVALGAPAEGLRSTGSLPEKIPDLHPTAHEDRQRIFRPPHRFFRNARKARHIPQA
jgi:hypothetical protein